jgi:hypothetical protein
MYAMPGFHDCNVPALALELPAQNMRAVEPVAQDDLGANRHADGIERPLGGTEEVRFDVGVFLCHCNDGFALCGELKLPVADCVTLAATGDPLLEKPPGVAIENAKENAPDQALGEVHRVAASDLEHPFVHALGPRKKGSADREAKEEIRFRVPEDGHPPLREEGFEPFEAPGPREGTVDPPEKDAAHPCGGGYERQTLGDIAMTTELANDLGTSIGSRPWMR